MRHTWLSLLVLAGCVLGSLPARATYYEATYTAGRCDATVQMLDGDEYQFTPALSNPGSANLWLLVLAGGTNVIITDGQADATDGLYLKAGDLLLMTTVPAYELFIQGGTLTVAYGGVSPGAAAAPVCATGAAGPVLLEVDQAYDAKLQSSTSGVAAQVASYGSVASRTSGTLTYAYVSGYTLQGTFTVPSCTTCCDPTQTIFPVNKAGSVPFTVYTITAVPAANFDYLLALPSALQATAAAAPTSGTAPLSVAFTGKAAGGVPPYTWDWNFADGSAHSTLQNPTHSYAAGTFKPVLTVKDSTGGTSKDTHLSITATSAYAVTANASPSQGQAPLAVSFGAAVTGGTAPFTYSWDFGDGTATSAEQNPAHTYTAVGDYRVALVVTDATGARATDNHLLIKVLGPGALAASAQADRTFGLYPLPVNFTGTASGGTAPYSYQWDFGDGTSGSTQQNPLHTFATPGYFTVTFTVADSGGQTATDDHLRILVASSFTVTISAVPTAGPPPLAVAFTSSVAGGTAPFTYAWDFGDGGTSAEASPSHTYGASGTFAVSLTVTDASSQTAVSSPLTISVGGGEVPVVTGVSVLTSPFRLKVTGIQFKPGCIAYIGGTPVPVTAYKSATKVVAKSGSALKAMVPKATPVCVQVLNPDGRLSNCFMFAR